MNLFLKRLEVLDYYDGPELLLARDQFDALHLVNFCAVTDEGREVFYSTLISRGRLEQLRKGTVTVRDIYESPEMPVFFRMEMDGREVGEINATIETHSSLPEEFLPPSDYLPDCSKKEPLLGQHELTALLNEIKSRRFREVRTQQVITKPRYFGQPSASSTSSLDEAIPDAA